MLETTTMPAYRVTAEGEIEGYIAIWGSPTQRDSYNTWFDQDAPPELGIKGFLPIRLLYKHGRDKVIKRTIVGKIVRVWVDDTGIAFKARLDKACRFFQRVLNEVTQGRLAISSGSSDHLAEFDDEGRFVDWLLSEVSLEDEPAEPRMPKVKLIRSSKDTQNYILGVESQASEEPQAAPTASNLAGEEPLADPAQTPNRALNGEKPMLTDLLAPGTQVSPEELVAAMVQEYGIEMVSDLIKSMQPAGEDQPMPEAATALSLNREAVQKMSAHLETLRAAQPKPDVAGLQARMDKLKAERAQQQHSAPAAIEPTPQRSRTPHIEGGENLRYAHLGFREMAFIHEAVRGAKEDVSPDFMRHMAMKMAIAAEKGDSVATDFAVRSAFPLRHVRADEIMQSTLVGAGDEWVGIAYSSTLWEKVRYARMYSELKKRGMMELEIAQGEESTYVPTEGSDPTWHAGTQAGDLDATNQPEVTVKTSKPGTGRVQLTPGEAVAEIMWSDTMDEDSLIPMAQQLLKQMEESAEEAIEFVIFNGDTATGANTNINLIDGTPATGLDTPLYLVTNGILKLPLVTHAARSRDAGGTLDEDDYRLTFGKLPGNLRSNKAKLMYVIDPDTELATLNIDSIKTQDTFKAATIESGEIRRMWGIDVFASGQIALANNVGKVPTGGGTLGRIACIYPPYWALGWKRRVKTEQGRDIRAGVNYIVSRMRVGVQYRSVDAAAITYNVPIT